MPAPTMILMSSLAGAGSAQAFARERGLPATWNGQRAVYGWCEAARVGAFKAGGRVVQLSRSDLDALAERHGRMIEAGVNVPIVLHGRENERNVLGCTVLARREGDALHVLSMFVGDAAADEAKTCRFGAGLDANFTDSRGVRYGQAMRHLAAREATVEQLSAAQTWRDGGPSMRNPLLYTARWANPPKGAIALSAALPHAGDTAEQALDGVLGLSRSEPTPAEFFEPL